MATPDENAVQREREERRQQEERMRMAERAITEGPGNPDAQEEYRAATREARSAFPWVSKAQTPDLRADFEHVQAGVRKKKAPPAKTKPALELNPPGHRGMGQGRPVVSPQLREEERDRAREKALKKMLLAREFNRKARDAFER